MAFAISSTAVVLRILEQKRDLHRIHGRLAFGILLMQDLVALLLLAAVPLLAHWSGEARPTAPVPLIPGLSAPMTAFAKVCIAIGGIAALILAGRLAMPRMLRAAAGSGETLLVVSSALALAAAVATSALGFSPELGAFLAGFLLSSTPFRYQIAGQLVPLRDLLPRRLLHRPGSGPAAPARVCHNCGSCSCSCRALTLKTLITAATAWALGATAAVAVYVGLALAQGGEFSLVLLRQARASGVLTPDQAGYGIAMVVLSLVLTPAMVNAARAAAGAAVRLPSAPWFRTSSSAPRPSSSRTLAPRPSTPRPPRLPMGTTAPPSSQASGPVGRAVADKLERRGLRITIVELNPRTVEKQQQLGRNIVYGDIANPEVLERAGVRDADAVILTVPTKRPSSAPAASCARPSPTSSSPPASTRCPRPSRPCSSAPITPWWRKWPPPRPWPPKCSSSSAPAPRAPTPALACTSSRPDAAQPRRRLRRPHIAHSPTADPAPGAGTGSNFRSSMEKFQFAPPELVE
jgi:Kef-type K+ transport system membrane component KefB